MSELRSEFLFTIRIALHPLQLLGSTPHGQRSVCPVSGGEFAGPRLSGTILPHAGADHLLRRADDSFQQDVRMTLETNDGALILMTYRGVRYAPAEVSARIARGERVDRHEYYLRTAPFFETGAERYLWLNRIASIGVGERTRKGADYEIFQIL
jgi:hypothetical protein